MLGAKEGLGSLGQMGPWWGHPWTALDAGGETGSEVASRADSRAEWEEGKRGARQLQETEAR